MVIAAPHPGGHRRYLRSWFTEVPVRLSRRLYSISCPISTDSPRLRFSQPPIRGRQLTSSSATAVYLPFSSYDQIVQFGPQSQSILTYTSTGSYSIYPN